MAQREIAVRGLGPIETLIRIPLPEEGGIVELLGENGAGKSTALKAVHVLAGGDDEISVNDRAIDGEVYGLGAHVAFGRRQVRSGELVVRSLRSSIDPSVLIDPRYVQPDVRDDYRARMLCSLAGIGADLNLFARLHPKFAELVSAEAKSAATLPDLAKLGKRDFEKLARAAELRVEGLQGKASGAAVAAGGVDTDAPHDANALAAATESAVRALANAEGEQIAAKKRGDAWRSAKAKLDAASAGLSPFAVKAAETRIAEAKEQVAAAESELLTATDAVDKRVQEFKVTTQAVTDTTTANEQREAVAVREGEELIEAAKRQAARLLEEAQQVSRERAGQADSANREAHSRMNEAQSIARSRLEQLEAARRMVTAEEAARTQAVEAESAVADVRALVDAGAGDAGPTAEALAALRAAVDAARKAQEFGVLVRAAREKRLEAQECTRQAEEAAAEATDYRRVAGACFDVVTSAIARFAPQGLRFHGGRLILKTERGDTLFDELSVGEKVRIVIAAVAEAVGDGGIFTIDQGFWGELQPQVKHEMHELCRAKRIVGITARATDGDLEVALVN